MSSLTNLIAELKASSNLSLILATVWVVTKVYPTKTRGPTIIGQYANTKMAHIEHNALLDAILVRISNPPTTRALIEADNRYEGSKTISHRFFEQLSNENYFFLLNFNKRKAIWLVDSLSSYMRLERDLLNERNHYHRSGFFCIIYTGREPDRMDMLRTIFQRLFSFDVVNVNVLMPVDHVVFVYTYFPFTVRKCHNFDPFLYDVFGLNTDYKFSRDIFFPIKLRNMWGCPVNVTTWTKLPFVDIEYNRLTGEIIKLKGIEGMLLALISQRMNFTIRIVEEPHNRTGNGKKPGSVKMLSDGLTNISVSDLVVNAERQQTAQASYFYLYVPLSIVIPLGKLMTPLERLMRPFKYIIWSCLSSSLLCGICIIFLLKTLYGRKVQEFVFGQRNRRPFTNLWSVFYGGPTTTALPRRNFSRYLLGIWLFYTFVLRSAYLAQLFLILQDSRARSELTTVNEVLEQNFTFYAVDIAVPVLLNATSKKIRIKHLEDDQHSLSKLFKILSENENAQIAITAYGPLVWNYNQNNIQHQVNILQEPLFNAPVAFYMRQHSYLATQIDATILNSLSAGLIHQFGRLSMTQRAFKVREKETYIQIPLSLLIGLFIVYFVLLLVSIVVFFLELGSNYSPTIKKVLDFFNI